MQLPTQIIPLVEGGPTANNVWTDKAGLLPFFRDGAGKISFYVMKPHAMEKELEPPTFQICKGTRMVKYTSVDGTTGWRDITSRDWHTPDIANHVETHIETAIREGIEEVGLKTTNVKAWYDAGLVFFRSVKTGKEKSMWLFVAEVKSRSDFDAPHAELAGTAECRWCTLDDFAKVGRPDHYEILKNIIPKLAA